MTCKLIILMWCPGQFSILRNEMADKGAGGGLYATNKPWFSHNLDIFLSASTKEGHPVLPSYWPHKTHPNLMDRTPPDLLWNTANCSTSLQNAVHI